VIRATRSSVDGSTHRALEKGDVPGKCHVERVMLVNELDPAPAEVAEGEGVAENF
jgi:hypothetical protein